MKLLLLYGPPAVGKLTIAKEIARLTGLKLFHAHLTVDLVASIFPRGTPAYLQLIWDIRFAVFAEAARAHLDGLIFTTVYGRDREPFLARCVEVVESCGGEVGERPRKALARFPRRLKTRVSVPSQIHGAIRIFQEGVLCQPKV
jgi:hypothetical protein